MLFGPRTVALLWMAFASCNPTSATPASSSSASPQLTAEAGTEPPPIVPVLPMEATMPDALSNEQVRHTELLRITRDFGKENYVIAFDAWVPADGPAEITDLRLWWLKTHKGDERSPFGKKTNRHFDLEYDRLGPDKVDVHMVTDRKTFTFHAELNGEGIPEAFADIDSDEAGKIDHCKVSTAELVARRFLGAPVGIKRLRVTCTDDAGTEHAGKIQKTKRR